MTIAVSRLTKEYGSFRAVNDISFHVNPGEIFGFLGVNGAGKTTTLRMLSGVLQPTSGSISLGGFDIAHDPVSAKRITGYIPDRPYLYQKLTGREFLVFIGDLYSLLPEERDSAIEELLAEYRLTEWQDKLIEGYSHGMKQRLATCAALVHRPKILIVDEPMVGLDPHGARFLKEALRRYAEKGMSIILSTHTLHVAEELAHRLAIIDKGSLVTIGTLDDIRALSRRGEEKLENLFLELTASDDEAALV